MTGGVSMFGLCSYYLCATQCKRICGTPNVVLGGGYGVGSRFYLVSTSRNVENFVHLVKT
jgi:hypothetical protein